MMISDLLLVYGVRLLIAFQTSGGARTTPLTTFPYSVMSTEKEAHTDEYG